ncbi:hypothetical protein BDV95DRAFT_597418 [Massariosphaeria phaeospora]|uniref:Homeobox domain-containing protein n=1 Tax=Massariosphaeria phaeospora TaxID=100035 RepID=A0A7C8I9Z0_9PLEO|nr:hypothetical protein BDV95DRAFT_597418 [Massariosphaeria phaeospora]
MPSPAVCAQNRLSISNLLESARSPSSAAPEVVPDLPSSRGISSPAPYFLPYRPATYAPYGSTTSPITTGIESASKKRRLDSVLEPRTTNDKGKQSLNLRYSPPIQPNEQSSSQQLPPISELLKSVEPSPPPTPSRTHSLARPGSSLVSTPFAEVEWAREKRQRTGDYHHTSYASEYALDTGRQSIAIDPALETAYSTTPSHQHRTSEPYPRPSESVYSAAPNYQHRASAPYPPPSDAVASSSHHRHQSTPAPHGYHSHEHRPPALPSIPTPIAYPSQPLHPGAYETQHISYQNMQAPPIQYYPAPYPPGPAAGYDGAYAYQQNSQQSMQNFNFQQIGADPHNFNRKRRGNLPKDSTNKLKKWYSDHRESPYPTEEEKHALCVMTHLNMNQVSNWFINARRRSKDGPHKERCNSRDTVTVAATVNEVA